MKVDLFIYLGNLTDQALMDEIRESRYSRRWPLSSRGWLAGANMHTLPLADNSRHFIPDVNGIHQARRASTISAR